MPKQRVSEDNLWAAQGDVLFGNSFEYVAWLCCGGTRPNFNFSEIRDTRRLTRSPRNGASFYNSISNTGLYSTPNFQQHTTALRYYRVVQRIVQQQNLLTEHYIQRYEALQGAFWTNTSTAG